MKRRLGVGREIAGRYRIEEFVGRGGLADVYRATALSTQEQVALKQMRQGESKEVGIEHFLREARTQAGLTHKNIIACHDIVEDSGDFFIAMEFVEGQTLAALFYRSRTFPRMPLPELAGIFEQLFEGLAHAHGQGVIHRDIKPANLMLTAQSALKIGDFGLAFNPDEQRLTKTGTILGTPAYVSPEQLQGLKDLDQRVDIYSAGVTLYESLCGCNPFLKQGEHLPTYELIGRQLFAQPYTLEEQGLRVSRELQLVVSRSLAKDRDDRFASCQEFWQALEFALKRDPLWEQEPSTQLFAPGEHTLTHQRKLKRIKYVSAFSRELSVEELQDLVDHAQRANKAKGITGCLAASGELFFQIIEGPVEEIDALFARIERDERHEQLIVLREQQQFAHRLYPEWSMRLLDLSEEATDRLAPLREILQTIFEQSRSIERLSATLERGISRAFERQRKTH